MSSSARCSALGEEECFFSSFFLRLLHFFSPRSDALSFEAGLGGSGSGELFLFLTQFRFFFLLTCFSLSL